MEAWEEVLRREPLRPLYRVGSDQAAWNRVVTDFSAPESGFPGHRKLNTVAFPPEAVRLPRQQQLSLSDCAMASIIHFASGKDKERVVWDMTESYLQLFYTEEPAPLIDIARLSDFGHQSVEPLLEPEVSDRKEVASRGIARNSKPWFRFKHLCSFTGGAILEDDYDWLVEFVAEQKIHRVIEFGPGDSTFAFLENDCEILSFENDLRWLATARRRFAHFPNVTVLPYENEEAWSPAFSLQDWAPQLAFIDSPAVPADNPLARTLTVNWTSQLTSTIILHDARRNGEREIAERLQAEGCQVSFVATERGLSMCRPGAMS